MLNQSEKCNYNPNWIWVNKIPKKISVYWFHSPNSPSRSILNIIYYSKVHYFQFKQFSHDNFPVPPKCRHHLITSPVTAKCSRYAIT